MTTLLSEVLPAASKYREDGGSRVLRIVDKNIKFTWKLSLVLLTGLFRLSKPGGYYMYHQVQHSQILRSAHTVYLCVLCGSENRQRLFHCTTLTDRLVFVTETESVYCAVRTDEDY